MRTLEQLESTRFGCEALVVFEFTKGRVTRTAEGEDRLTAAVFGLLRHLPSPEFLHPWLQDLAQRNPVFQWDPEDLPTRVEVEPWPQLEVPDALGQQFSVPKKMLIPDAAIHLRWPDRAMHIYVEAEWSKPVEVEQLAQQWSVLLPRASSVDGVLLLLVGRSMRCPFPETSRPEIWAGEGRLVATRSVEEWVGARVATYETKGVKPAAHLMEAAQDRFRHGFLYSAWGNTSEVARTLARQSWAYEPLFRGLLGYMEAAGVGPAPRARDLLHFGSDRLLDDRARQLYARPEPVDCRFEVNDAPHFPK